MRLGPCPRGAAGLVGKAGTLPPTVEKHRFGGVRSQVRTPVCTLKSLVANHAVTFPSRLLPSRGRPERSQAVAQLPSHQLLSALLPGLV